MDAAAELTSYVLGKAGDALLGVFKTQVVDRWSRYRAREFFAAFSVALRSGTKTDEEVSRDLSAILADEAKSEAMFEAYRRVCLSRSKTLGPRCIALLTAELMTATKPPPGNHEAWFDLFETGTNQDIGGAEAYFRECFANNRNGHADYQIKRATFRQKCRDRAWSERDEYDSSPIDLYTNVGPWAARLQRCGIVSTKTQEVVEKSRIDNTGTRIQTHWIEFDVSCEQLGKLIARAMALPQPSQPAK